MNDEIVVEVHDTNPPDPDEGFTRAEVLERTVVAGGVIAAGGVLVTGLPRLAAAAPSRTQDVEVLNFALLLESLQATFYAEALRVGGLTGERRQFAEVVGGQERAHRAYLRRTLGSRARSVPRFRVAQAVGGDERFVAAATALEDLGLAAYNGQATNLTRSALRAAARLISVEARHAAWIRDLGGRQPAPDASDAAASEEEVRRSLRRQGLLG